MELELKHLAPYLPYGLKVLNIQNDLIFELETDFLSYTIKNRELYKLVLRPLSDLTKEIEHNGEIFVPIRKLHNTHDICISEGFILNVYGFYYSHRDMHRGDIELCTTYGFFQKLLEWHFDIFGLIEYGQAIDINTLNK